MIVLVRVTDLFDDRGPEDGKHDRRRDILPAHEEETVRTTAYHQLDVVTEPAGGRRDIGGVRGRNSLQSTQ